MSSRRLGLATSLIAVVALGACTGDDPPEPSYADPTVAVDRARQTYGPLVRDVADEVAGVAGTQARRVGPETVWFDSERDGCAYSSARYELAVVFGEEVGWPEVRDAVAGVLETHGFDVTDQLDIPGGYNGFDAVADDGGRFEVRSKLGMPSTIDLDAPVLGDCPASGSETLAP
ncbi:MAG: hypothetical protein JWO76_3428 [Nocardioides sp.]|nr:hypothetical protein [Nocardioides sp.]